MSHQTKGIIKEQTAVRSVSILIGSSVLLQGLGFLYRMVLSRMLTAEQMGLYGLMMPIYSVLNAGTISGFSLAASRTAAECTDVKRRLDHGGRIFHAALRCYLPIFLVVAILFTLCSGWVAGQLGEKSLQSALLLFLPCLLMTAFENILKSVFQGLRNVTPSMISECTEQAVRILAVWLLLRMFGKGATNAAVCGWIVCGMIISEVVSDWILGYFAGTLLGQEKSDAATERKILRCAVPVSAGNACGMLLSTFSAAIVPTALQRHGLPYSEALAEYGELSGILLPLLGIPGAVVYPIFTVMLPRITASYTVGDSKRLRYRIRRTMVGAAVIGGCLEGLVVLYAPQIGKLCFGKAYPAGSGQLILLGLTTWVSFIGSAGSCVMNALDRQSILVTVGLSLGVVEWLLLYPAITWYGIKGYAVVSLLLTGIQTAVIGWNVVRTER